MNRKKLRKRKILRLCLALIIFAQSFVLYRGGNGFVYAQAAPTVPTAPTPPPEPENEIIPPSEPTAPPEPIAPEAPTVPTAPTLDEVFDPASTPDPAPTENSEEDSSELPDNTSSGSNETQSDLSEVTSSNTGQTADGQTGTTEIETGDAINSVTITNDANANIAMTDVGFDAGGVKIVNSSNGDNSINSGSVKITDNESTVQDNSISVVNNLDQGSNTGNNSTSKNVGNSSIDTGDANTTGTIINAVNTNVDGVAISEFNVADDHVGDIILDFETGCISGCGSADVVLENLNNGSNSANLSDADLLTNDNTFQNNDAVVENNMTLTSNSGNNIADKNTGGDSVVETGDANVSANVLNFANNNLAGGVVYAVVNIFGDLVGDIIMPGGVCCFASTTVLNSGNGAGSENAASIDQTINDSTLQFNEANIENILVFDANTGGNAASQNTNGDSSIETGDSTIDAQVVNIANTNIDGGDWWLVIVNEAGNWVGKIFGGPDGSNMAGSEGFEFEINENGEVTVENSGNGAGSSNTGSVSMEENNTLVQTNTANITNNINLSANTGGNSASRNVGGDSSIETGDASVVANIVNFVNNNIAGSGRLFVSVVNVFGSWFGDFVSPGYEKDDQLVDAVSSENEIGGVPDQNQSQNSDSLENSQSIGGISDSGGGSNNDSNSNNSSSGTDSGSSDSSSASPSEVFPSVLASTGFAENDSIGFGNNEEDGKVDLGAIASGFETEAKKNINFNMAWLLFSIPLFLLVRVVRRKELLSKLLPSVAK